jgi:hypothetical protein
MPYQETYTCGPCATLVHEPRTAHAGAHASYHEVDQAHAAPLGRSPLKMYRPTQSPPAAGGWGSRTGLSAP